MRSLQALAVQYISCFLIYLSKYSEQSAFCYILIQNKLQNQGTVYVFK